MLYLIDRFVQVLFRTINIELPYSFRETQLGLFHEGIYGYLYIVGVGAGCLINRQAYAGVPFT